VGDGPLREALLNQVKTLSLDDHVQLLGFQEDVHPYLQAADVFALTSYNEGFSLAVLEAMVFGLPCVVTNVGGNAEAITHHVHGFVVPPGSIQGVADGISYLAAHPDERAEMSRLVRARVRQKFDFDQRVSNIKRLILPT
jgi:glycosyltransferase involved in cell wall biosynthesis